MPKCPNCGKEIDHLIEHSHEIVYYDFRLVDGEADWIQTDDESECTGTSEYHCPECYQLLVIGQDKAEKFLKGEVKGDEYLPEIPPAPLP